jgi:hypothetical protein
MLQSLNLPKKSPADFSNIGGSVLDISARLVFMGGNWGNVLFQVIIPQSEHETSHIDHVTSPFTRMMRNVSETALTSVSACSASACIPGFKDSSVAYESRGFKYHYFRLRLSTCEAI